ncbi:uncharacterized protein BDR25DRAFT_248353, partial [Lindgomyces ingoldianus]
INRKDQEEKADQIQLMGEIYNKATRVLVWLGEDTNGEAELALNRIRSIALAEDNLPSSRTRGGAQ